MATDEDRVHDLYRVVASLNVKRHPDFVTIVFSDTVVVHHAPPLLTAHDKDYVVMYLCEFAQDLIHRLVGRDVMFRAVLIRGGFEHYHLNDVPCFFGPALIDAYEAEKKIKAIGLFMHSDCLAYNRIFPTLPHDGPWHFVYLTQQLTEFEDVYGGELPLPSIVAMNTDMCWILGPEILYLKSIFEQSRAHPDPDIRSKYDTTWSFYARRYPRATQSLIAADFSLAAVSPTFAWEELLQRIPEDCSSECVRTDPPTGG